MPNRNVYMTDELQAIYDQVVDFVAKEVKPDGEKWEEDGKVPRDVWFLVRETAGVGDFVGPHGAPEPLDDAEVDRILKIVRASDCWMAGVARNAEGAAELFERGYDFCTSAIDVWLLRDGAKAAIEPLRDREADR